MAENGAKTQRPVTLVIDGRDVEVAPGTGLVEAAAEIGIEIPVFCYEPRIGPAVGACRMCLVEIEGMPKLQTACSTEVREGMVVATASKPARTAQEAVLEFLLANHPLDCPVCDKGGECPLQDQSYRYGNGESRFAELKRNADKPIPVSPLIALDRERCILCYRCTRFSDELAGDRQLVPRQRGANTVITTFEGRPYADRFSGNIIELCPVGALTSTDYRFHGRPWEVPDHPSTCGLCPVGCANKVSVREGKVLRIQGRENPEVADGWLCDRGRFSWPSMNDDARIVTPYENRYRDRPQGNRPRISISMEGALEWLGENMRSHPPLFVLSGSETVEEAWISQRIASCTGGRVVAVQGGSAAAPPADVSARISEVASAAYVWILTDADIAEVAPVIDLRLRTALQRGAKVKVAGIGGSRLEAAGAACDFVLPHERDEYIDRLIANGASQDESDTAPRVIIVRDGDVDSPRLEKLAESLHAKVLSIPDAANARGLSALGIEPVTISEIAAHNGGLIFFNVDAERLWRDDEWRPAVKAAKWVAAVSMFDEGGLASAADVVLPATFFAEKEGSLVNLEGRIQRLSQAVLPVSPIATEYQWLREIARRLDVEAPQTPAGAFRHAAGQASESFPMSSYSDIGEMGVVGIGGLAQPLPNTSAPVDTSLGDLNLLITPFLYDSADVRHARRMEFLRNESWITFSAQDAETLGVKRGDKVVYSVRGVEVTSSVAISRRVMTGWARMFSGTPGLPNGCVGVHAVRPEKAVNKMVSVGGHVDGRP